MPPVAVVEQPTTRYVTVPVARAYYSPFYYPPVVLPFGFYGQGQVQRHGHFRGHERPHW
jgi:hypothetical protein